MLSNQHLEPISTSMSVGPQRISTPPYTPHHLRSSIKTLISTPLLPPIALIVAGDHYVFPQLVKRVLIHSLIDLLCILLQHCGIPLI